MSTSAESVGTSPNEHERSSGTESDADDIEFSSTTTMFLSSSSSDSENSERHPRKWNNDQVLRWFQFNKLDELYNLIFYPEEAKDGAALDKIFKLKLYNYESYRNQFTRRLHSDNKNLLKDFDQFGPLLDNCFIDKYAYRFDVAFSFPGNIREQVSGIADKLCEKINTRQGEQRLFYDNYHKAELARPDLDLYLQSIYRYEARLIVVFMCERYNRREWCGLEGRSIRGLLKAHQNNRIMLLTVDGKTIDGISDIDGYWDIRDENEDTVVEGIYQRLKALGEPLPLPGTLRLPSASKNRMSKMIVASGNIFHSISPWYIVVALLSYILGTLTGH